jgi:hypothetical protein
LTTTVFSLTLLAALAAEPAATVKPIAGDSVRGELTGLTATEIKLKAASGERIYKANELMWVELGAEAAAEKPAMWVELVDGSKLQAAQYTVASAKARISLACGVTTEIPTRNIRNVRFRPQQSAELARQWREIAASTPMGDVVVIHRSTTRPADEGQTEAPVATDESLDQLEGTLLDITADGVQFEFDSEKINIRRDKLEGLVYFHPAKREFAPPACRIIDGGGSSWLVRDVKLDADRLTATTLSGDAIDFPISAVSKIDFSVGNIVLLSEIEPDSGTGEPGVSLQPGEMAYKFGRVFQVRPGPPLGADAFRIGGQRFDTGISLHSPLTLVYRVPEGFRWFRAMVGVDDSVLAPGRFDVIIKGDGKELARHSFSAEAGAVGRGPIPMALNISGVRRISIVLDPADGQDIGDQLDLCEARFTK